MDDEASSARRKDIEEKVRIAREEQNAPKKALTRAVCVEKLNAVPVFTVLNADKNAVSMKEGPGATAETIFWHVDPARAHAQLESARVQNPCVPGLHVGAGTLGLAFSLFAGWSEAQHGGDSGAVGGVEAPPVRHMIMLEQGTPVEMPVFLCDQLQTQYLLPVFLDRRDLASEWIRSGRTRESFTNDNVMVVDLRKFVSDMQTDAYDLWATVRFVPPAAARGVMEKAAAGRAKAIADGDEPPPLE